MMEDRKYKEIEIKYITTILLAIAEQLKSENYSINYITQKTKLVKLICHISDELKLPLTISWFRHGEYPFIQTLNIDISENITKFYKDFDSNFNKMDSLMKELCYKVGRILKKMNVSEIMKKNYFLFLEQYYNNSKFDDKKYIGLYRCYFHLINYLENEFIINIEKTISKVSKPDYKQFIAEEYEFVDEEPLFSGYQLQTKKLRNIFNRFLFELYNSKYDFYEDILENTYYAFNLYEQLCLKLDLSASERKIDKDIFKDYNLISEKVMFFWEMLTSYISTKDNRGLRTKELILFYSRLLENHREKIPIEIKKLKIELEKSKLLLTKKEFSIIKKEGEIKDDELNKLIHDFTLRV